jgi:putative DNA primase/helicase
MARQHASHSSGETWARAVWDTWSQRSAKYDPTTQEEKWASFTPEGGVTLGTIFHEAAQYGYTPTRPSLAVGQQQQSGAPPRQTTPPTAAGATAGATAAQWGTPGQQAPAPRPDIIIGPEIADIADAAEDALLHLPGAPIVYQRARGLCVIAYGADAPKWLHRPEDVPIAMDASTAYLRELVSRAALWWKLDKRTKKYEQALPPPWVVDTLQGRVSWPFPSLEGIVYSPTIRPDGSVLDTPGYDAHSALWAGFQGGISVPISPAHSRA